MRYFLTDPFVHHITINLSYLPVNDGGLDGLDFFRIHKRDISLYQ